MLTPKMSLYGQSGNLPMGYLAGTVICKFLSIPDWLKLRKGK